MNNDGDVCYGCLIKSVKHICTTCNEKFCNNCWCQVIGCHIDQVDCQTGPTRPPSTHF